jgi:hypothetical protein
MMTPGHKRPHQIVAKQLMRATRTDGKACLKSQKGDHEKRFLG